MPNTVSVTAGSAVVTGDVTSFVAAEGDLFCLAGLAMPIASRQSTSQLTLRHPWPGATLAGRADYDILPTGPYWQSSVTTNKLVTDLLTKIDSGLPLKADATGSLAGRAAYDNQPAGFIYFDTESNGGMWTAYVKRSSAVGDWSSGAQIRATAAQSTAAAEAARDAAQTYAGQSYAYFGSAQASAAAGSASSAQGSAGSAAGSAASASGSAWSAASSASSASGSASAAASSAAQAAASSGIPSIAGHAGQALTVSGDGSAVQWSSAFAQLTGAVFTGAVTTQVAAGYGKVTLQPGAASPDRTGYVEFHNAAGLRLGYIGFGSTVSPGVGGILNITAENYARWEFNGSVPTIGGQNIATTADAAGAQSAAQIYSDARLEVRAADYANDRLATAKAYSDARLESRGGEIADYYASVRASASQSAAQTYSDARLEIRAADYANDRLATAKAYSDARLEDRGAQIAGAYGSSALTQANAHSDAIGNARFYDFRQVFVADLGNEWAAGQTGYYEPYAGAHVTGRQTDANTEIRALRFRQNQCYRADIGWYSAYYA